MPRKLHRRDVIVSGCDDSTAITDLFTVGEINTLEKLAKEITAAGGGCKPTMAIREHVHDDIGGARCDACQEDF